jgi:dTMP kinase
MFITFEGPEGSGKTTQIPALAHKLRSHGYNVITTREPGGTEIGDQIRSVLLARENKKMHERTEILLFLAARAQLIEEHIRPHLESHGVVISDRYADSTLAYQGYGRGADIDQLQILLDFATRRLKPDLTFLLDIDVAEGLKRKMDGIEWNRLDECELSFHEQVRRGYHELALKEPERWKIVDAGQAPASIETQIQEETFKRLLSKG